MVDLATLLADPLDAVADLLAGLAHHVTDVLGTEGVRVDVQVEAVVAARAVALHDDAQVEGIDAESAQLLADLVDVGLVEVARARQDRRRLSVGEGEFLAGEDAGVVLVVRGENHVRRATSYACNSNR